MIYLCQKLKRPNLNTCICFLSHHDSLYFHLWCFDLLTETSLPNTLPQRLHWKWQNMRRCTKLYLKAFKTVYNFSYNFALKCLVDEFYSNYLLHDLIRLLKLSLIQFFCTLAIQCLIDQIFQLTQIFYLLSNGLPK